MGKALKIAAVYIGLIIGAGFASGREILEYFNLHSSVNFSGILVSSVLFITVAYIILKKSSEENIKDYRGYIERVAGKAAPVVKVFTVVYMFCGFSVMLAGSGALFDSLTPYSPIFGSALLGAVCLFAMCFDIKGVVWVNLLLVPLMICGIIYVSVCTFLFKSTGAATFGFPENMVILPAICYSGYNLITAGSVLVPLGKGSTAGQIRWGAVSGGFIIGVLILIVWTVQGMNLEILRDSELPMLTLAALCGKTCKYVYAAVLFMAICTTAVSCCFGITDYFSANFKTRKSRMAFSLILSLLGIFLSLYGFSGMVSNIYSLFGYLGIVWIVWIIIDRYR